MEKRKRRLWVLFLGVLLVVLSCYILTFGPFPILRGPILRVISNLRHIHKVSDLPSYPSAKQIRNADNVNSGCSGVMFETQDKPEDVQDFYLEELGGPLYGWYGDGSSYPDYNPMTRHHEKHGERITFYLAFKSSNGNETQISMSMCPKEE